MYRVKAVLDDGTWNYLMSYSGWTSSTIKPVSPLSLFVDDSLFGCICVNFDGRAGKQWTYHWSLRVDTDLAEDQMDADRIRVSSYCNN
ncbi:hypothetical protein RRG08_031922 [Elysia crispata]|uniref:Uncharacterized protein n=1 Tax=Elysia crispata TaxID=231223 RepID=A0AAE1DZV6_9GAST|nr:hypothetical protein RRG08_031922 [Elysia crispata]